MSGGCGEGRAASPAASKGRGAVGGACGFGEQAALHRCSQPNWAPIWSVGQRAGGGHGPGRQAAYTGKFKKTQGQALTWGGGCRASRSPTLPGETLAPGKLRAVPSPVLQAVPLPKPCKRLPRACAPGPGKGARAYVCMCVCANARVWGGVCPSERALHARWGSA